MGVNGYILVRKTPDNAKKKMDMTWWHVRKDGEQIRETFESS